MVTYKITTANYYVTVEVEDGCGNVFTDLTLISKIHGFPKGIYLTTIDTTLDNTAHKYKNLTIISLPNYSREEVESIFIPKNAITSISLIK